MSRDRNRFREYPEEQVVAPRRRRPQRRWEDEEEEFRRPRRRRGRRSCLVAGCLAALFVIILGAAAVFVLTRNLPGSNIGGIGGIVNPSAYTQTSQQSIPVSNLAQLQVHNQIGNVTVAVDPNAAPGMATLTTIKKVKAANSSDAQSQFGGISLQVQPPVAPDYALTVSTNIPNSNGGILGKAGDSVDLQITLPVQSAANTPLTVNIMNSVGNVQVSGLNAMLVIKDDIGDVTVQQAQLTDGSHLETGTGNVTFNGTLVATGTLNADPCTNPSSNIHPLYKIQSEQGNVDVTLPADTNVILDANVNVGKINSDFAINITDTGGSPAYCGPLLTNPLTPPTAALVLDVSSGNIGLHKAP